MVNSKNSELEKMAGPAYNSALMIRAIKGMNMWVGLQTQPKPGVASLWLTRMIYEVKK